jgi:hypothetical protein
MNAKIKCKVSGKLQWLRVIDKNGNLKHEVKDIPNLLFNSAMTGAYISGINSTCGAYTSTAESYEDLPGTWSQTGNTITRASGAGTFPVSPSHIGCELKWNTGERVHVTARTSDTQITVSGPARTITGGTIRRYLCNDGAFWGSAAQTSFTGTTTAVLDHAAGWVEYTRQVNFASATSAYTLGSVIVDGARVKLPATVAIDVEDQIQLLYSRRETVTGRNQSYELGAEAVGLPQKYSMLSIVGNGTNVDVTFSAATHFLAGDKLDLRGIITKKAAISSASSTSTTFTINTATAHGLIAGDSVTIEGASLAGYNGTFTVATAPTTTQLTITDAANPGAMGAAGTVRLTTPATYFDDLGLATIASMVSSSVARITSAITGPAVEPASIGGDPGIVVCWRRGDSSYWRVSTTSSGNVYFTEANVKALVDDSAQAGATGPTTTNGVGFDSMTVVSTPAYGNDFTVAVLNTKNAGTGTAGTRIKQFALNWNTGGMWTQITLNTPFNKDTSQRLKVGLSKQLLRDLP